MGGMRGGMAVVVVAVGLASGCQHLDPHGTASVCATNEPKLMEAVVSAVAYWNEAGLISLAPCAPGSIEVAIDPTLAERLGREGNTHISTNRPTIALDDDVVRKATSTDQAERAEAAMTIAHELGHAMGLAHDHDHESIMFPSLVPLPESPSPRDVALAKNL